jgi:hypothetical protein
MNLEGEPDALMKQDFPVLLLEMLENQGFPIAPCAISTQSIQLKHHPPHGVGLCDNPPPLEKAEVCLPRSYRGILDKVRMHKHTHKYIIP